MVSHFYALLSFTLHVGIKSAVVIQGSPEIGGQI